MSGKHIELFLVDGEPGGITTAEVAGWTGHVLVGPRSNLGELIRRPESSRNGAYLLLGEDSEAIENTVCYIGRTENFAERFRVHDAKKEFWDRAVIISAKDDSFNEGHWGYLEARLIEMARVAERASLPNVQTPKIRKLSEAQASDMEAFISQLKTVLPVLNVNVLKSRKAPVVEVVPKDEDSPTFTLVQSKLGVNAKAQVAGGEFTMLEGSTVVGEWLGRATAESTRRAYASYRARHEKLVADGSIVIDGKVGHLTRDIVFTSPSTAGAIALGRSCNGRTSWLWNGGTYAQWEERGVDSE
ncbi:GIY-YIG nuclease family protein [Gulosibacter sediminis]|uniref:GIY-YIG nuclease family protein n=1 Tax=Gulosibacter sediminis TaxID=1729695 RepID=UPI0024AE1833|nr:GIY-YIG nuclease family protein [Gulosibacter sediminis]